MANTHSTLSSLFSDIADSIRGKTGSSATIKADEFPSAIDAISTGPDLSNDTAVAADVRSGKTFHTSTGAATGSMANGSATTPATTITANPSISVSSAGLITASNSKTQSVTPTVSAGYVSSGTAGTITVSGSNTSQLTTKAATTWTPTTSNQTIAASTYLTGAQTIKGDANLVAANIASGVTIFGVTGTHAGGSQIWQGVVAPASDYASTISFDPGFDPAGFILMTAMDTNTALSIPNHWWATGAYYTSDMGLHALIWVLHGYQQMVSRVDNMLVPNPSTYSGSAQGFISKSGTTITVTGSASDPSFSTSSGAEFYKKYRVVAWS